DRVYVEQLNTAKAAQFAAEGAQLNAQLEVEKFTQLAANKVVSDYQLKTAQAQLKIANANVEQAKAQVASAQINVGYTLIKAPVSGYIGRLNKKQGSLVSPQDVQALTTLSDVHNVRAYFSLSETDFINFKEQYKGSTLQEKLKHVPPVQLVLSNGEIHNVKGKIDMVDGQFDRNTSSITLRATFPNADGLLRSGNTGRIRLSLNHTNVNLIPTNATIEMQDKVFVYLLDDSNKVNKQTITIIGKNGNNYLVKTGVKTGDRIVTSGIDHLQEGQEITPEEASTSSATTNSEKPTTQNLSATK
ncbi:MAG TPA: efflux RND transporter periplasmic adaptor subunit, partial [Chitinophagales bacterium]